MTMPRLILLCVLMSISVGAWAQTESALRDAGDVPLQLAGEDSAEQSRVYIVQLRSPSAAERQAALAVQRTKFDRNSVSAKAWVADIEEEQKRVLAKAGPGTRQIYSYRYGLNGFAAHMSITQAQKLEHLPEVLNVWEDEVRPMATSHSPTFLGLFDGETGLRSVEGLDGDGVVIGVIDSGVAPEHPALQDSREADKPRACQSSWGNTTILGRWLCHRFKELPRVVTFDEPTDWNGECVEGERFETTDCNNKLIGARWFIDGALATGPIHDGEIRSPRDADGHGTHTATTAAGNRTSASLFGTLVGDIEGIAPKARIAVYKACWLRPGTTRASCNTSDLANAIDSAVADGVDIINYSVGSSLTRTTTPDDLALLAAAKAGILAIVAAGNEGPNPGTIGSPAGGPWVLTAAASSRDGESNVEAMELTAPPSLAGKYAVKEANFTPPLEDVDPVEAQLVLVDDDDTTLDTGAVGSEADGCQPLINGDEVDGNIAFLQRTGCRFDEMVRNAADAGAVAALIYNIAGDPVVMHGDSGLSDIPALMLGQADANLILAEFDAGIDVTAVLDKGFLLTSNDQGNEMATFSARGPAPIPDILKPDVTAPGVNILAGFTPDSAYSTPGENFAYLSGTSMATPHVAGVAALLRQAHPEWSPAAIKSALMTTSRQDIVASSGLGSANPLDFGAGHIVPNAALDPGLVYEITDEEYDAYVADMSGLARNLNLPSITMSKLASTQTVTRRVTNVSDEAGAYTIEISPPPGMGVTVVPNSISLAPGQSTTFDVTVTNESAPLDSWWFGSMTWRSEDHDVYSPIAVWPATVVAPKEIETFGGTGTLNFDVEFGYSGTYLAGVHGLNEPRISTGCVDNDPTKTFRFTSNSVPGTTLHKIAVPPDQLFVRFSLFDAETDGDDDLDMYVYRCELNGSNCIKLGESGGPTSEERFDVYDPAAGLYAIFVHGFETDQVSGEPGEHAEPDDSADNMTASGPAFVSTGTSRPVTVDWSGLLSNTRYLGGISHKTPHVISGLLDISGLTLITIRN